MSIVLMVTGSASGQSGAPTGETILSKVDTTLYTARDKEMKMKFVLTGKGGRVKERELEGMERGSEYRFMKFLSPADQKGIGFLSLPGEKMYLYLPAFGKVRRIASHVKNKNFAGTDLTYEDLEMKEYSPRWAPKILKEEDDRYVLELSPRPDTKSDYSRLTVTVLKKNHYPVLIEYFDRGGNALKTMTRGELKEIDGIWEAMHTTIVNHKNGHKTELILLEVKHNVGIPDEKFSTRYLVR
jgi:outer membrane lipoprotein-sorting protein